MIDTDRLATAFRGRAERLLRELAHEVSTSCEPDPPSGRVFVAEARARGQAGEIRMMFGDRELEIRTSVKPAGRPWPLELGFYLRAMGLDASGVADSMWVEDEDRMSRVMERHADALRTCLERLGDDASGWWSLAEEQRREALLLGKRQLREREMQVAVSRAAEAFRADDVERVVSLLSPYEDILGDAQTRKLRLARARLGPEPE